MAKVSVIVPVYQTEKYLCRCVSSVRSQSETDWELILVDDGSPDSCPRLCDEYAGQDSRIHVIHRKNGGLSAARNSGIDWVMANSGSSWITFLDSDDWLHRDFLRMLLKAGKQSEVFISACSYVHVSERAEDLPVKEAAPLILDGETAYAEHYGACMTACCKLIRRQLLETLRFPEGKLHEDAFITHLLIFAGGKVAITQESLYYYYTNPCSITRKTWTPKRLEELEAHGVRYAYLSEHGFNRALDAELKVIIETIYEHVEVLARLRDREYSTYLVSLRRDLRKALKAGKHLVPLNAETVWIYLMAWPARPLWYLGKKAQDAWHRRKK